MTAFRNLNVSGYSAVTDYQMSVGNAWLKAVFGLGSLVRTRKKQHINNPRELDGSVLPGELLYVLSQKGSGCSAFLKVIAGDWLGLEVDESSFINYHGITARQMTTRFCGEVIYTAEFEQHFPTLTLPGQVPPITFYLWPPAAALRA